MTHGGNRQGAGRKKGSSNKVSLKEVLNQVEEDQSKTPLEIMHGIMNKAYAAGMYDLALKAASAAAPYMHAKVTEESENARIIMRFEDMTDEQLEEFEARNRTADHADDGQGTESSQDGKEKPD